MQKCRQETTWKNNVMVAVKTGDTELLDRLPGFENRPTLDFINFEITPLQLAINGGNYAITEQLLCAGASTTFCDGSTQFPAVVMATLSENVRIFNLLLRYGADVNARSDRTSALTLAVSLRSDKFVQLLLKHGAQPCDIGLSDSWDNFKNSPFSLAIAWNQCGTVKMFLNYFRERSIQLPWLQLLIKRAIKESSEDCAIIFLKQGIYPHHNSPQTSSLFHMAAEKGRRKLMNLLVELNPQLLQEEWLIKKKVPHKLCKHTSYISWLLEYRQQVPSLQKLCKSSILSQLDSYYKPKIRDLPLPKSLKKYLCLLESAYDHENVI